MLCADWDDSIHLDVVPNPNAPTATVGRHKDRVETCFGGGCRELTVPRVAEAAVTDGVYVAVDIGEASYHTDVYRRSDGKHLYQLSDCGATAFLDGVLLANGGDCSGPLAIPYLADAATGKVIASLGFPQLASRPNLVALHVGGARWAIIEDGRSEPCAAEIIDIHTGAVSESLRCDPSFARIAASGNATSFVPAECPKPGRIVHASHDPITEQVAVSGLVAAASNADAKHPTDLVLVDSIDMVQLRHLEVGQTAKATLRDMPDKNLEGTVRAVSADRVEIAIHVPDGSVPPGTYASMVFALTSKPGSWSVPQRATYLRRGPYDADAAHPDRATVWVQRSGKLVPVEVRVGISDRGFVEIRAGLTDADAIALPPEDR